MIFVNIKIIPYPVEGCQLLVIGCPEAFSFKKLSDFTPFLTAALTIRYTASVGVVSNFASEKGGGIQWFLKCLRFANLTILSQFS